MARRRDGRRGPRDQAAGQPRWRQRWDHFVHDGQGEKDRFGIFDPFLRMMYGVAVALGLSLAIASFLESWGLSMGPVAVAMAAAGGLVGLVGGIWFYKQIWRTPSEREILLQMAREEDESRSIRARLDDGTGKTKKG